MATIFVLKDEDSTSAAVIETLEKLPFKTIEVESLDKMRSQLENNKVGLIIIDHQSKKKSALEKLAAIKNDSFLSSIPVVVITANSGSDEIIEMMKLGAFDHLAAPLNPKEIESVIKRAAPEEHDLSNVKDDSINNFLIGQSPIMHSVHKAIGMAAACDTTVLVVGESGTGKDTVARAIHAYSHHKNEPLTVIDCTAVPEDYDSFKSLLPGSRGTVILDEIGDLNIKMQAMLVRALKEATIETNELQYEHRIIATTQHNLTGMVKAKSLREDLYYRLHVFPIILPPLRERGADILALAQTFLREFSPRVTKHLSIEASKILLNYQWPGNVRELQNVMYHLSIIVKADVIEASDLDILDKSNKAANKTELPLDYYQAMNIVEKNLLERALQEANGSRAKAARLLGINRQLLYAKLKTHKLMS